jgi:hypothetical protein
MKLKLKRLAFAGLMMAGLTAPAFADTLQEITTKGMVLIIEGIGEIDVNYKPDGTWSADFMGMPINGTWRIDGDKLCSTSDVAPAEDCVAFPTGKHSGDSFEITSATGTATIRIK